MLDGILKYSVFDLFVQFRRTIEKKIISLFSDLILSNGQRQPLACSVSTFLETPRLSLSKCFRIFNPSVLLCTVTCPTLYIAQPNAVISCFKGRYSNTTCAVDEKTIETCELTRVFVVIKSFNPHKKIHAFKWHLITRKFYKVKPNNRLNVKKRQLIADDK